MANKDLKILVYGNRKQNDSFWDISTPELERAAYLELFKHLVDESGWNGGNVYADLVEKFEEESLPADHVSGCKCGRCFEFDSPIQTSYRKHEKARHTRQSELYAKAKAGDAAAAKALILERKSNEYEEVSIAYVRRAV